MIAQETVRIEPASYIYRVCHRIMEGDCQMDHGPKMVTVGPLEADVYCVTNAMYAQFLRESGYQPEHTENYLKHWENGSYREEDADLPVVNVSQDDAKAYAAFYGKRLPTEQEWQYLAAGPDKLAWPWGNEKRYACCNVFSEHLEPVNAHPEGRSPFGLYNMCGNVWEFTSERITDGGDGHTFIVLRGGSSYTAPYYWHTESGAVRNDCHLKVHLLGDAMDRIATAGFRCVREVR